MIIEFSGGVTVEPIMVDELEKALKEAQRASERVQHPTTDLYKLLEVNGVAALCKLLKERYDAGNVPQEILDTIFFRIPKKVRAFDCESLRTISLMSHTLKTLFKVLPAWMKLVLHKEINEWQYGIMPDKGTENTIFILRMLRECCIEVNGDVYSCFVDYIKAFDRVQHNILSCLNSGPTWISRRRTFINKLSLDLTTRHLNQ